MMKIESYIKSEVKLHEYPCSQDSGGFQMVSLLKLAKVTEEGLLLKKDNIFHHNNYMRLMKIIIFKIVMKNK